MCGCCILTLWRCRSDVRAGDNDAGAPSGRDEGSGFRPVVVERALISASSC